ncbi:MAG TPA: hypothetical protein VHX44_16945, partial [Planctomycetota bacterium]|nr:hypothetical protein [Planctomycetota bacterium]
MTNSSDGEVRIPGRVKPHGVVVHPTPQLAVAVGWRSPITSTIKLSGQVVDAHHDCGNGVTWVLERRRGTHHQRLAGGIAERNDGGKFTDLTIAVRPGDLLSLVIGPRGTDHTCDLTELELDIATIGTGGAGARTWSLSRDLSADPLAGNPHADAAGTPDVWHIYSEPATAGEPASTVPTDSLLARWLASEQPDEQQRLAQQLQAFAKAPAPKDGPDATLHRQLTSLTRPLTGPITEVKVGATTSMKWGVTSVAFGSHPTGGIVAANDLAVNAPTVITCRLPAELAVNAELVANVTLSGGSDGNAVRARVVAGAPSPSRIDWWSGDTATPLLSQPEGTAFRRISSVIADLQRLFPVSLCYNRIVPVDEVVTLTLFFRKNIELQRLVLNDDETAQLEHLWQHLHFVSQDALTQVDAFEQIWQYTTQ